MRAIKKSPPPKELIDYITDNPNATWNNFRDNARDALVIVKNLIQSDQKGICCYCEINFKDPSFSEHLEDFCVEHFYPKSKNKMENGENAHLSWTNLLGSCHGGSYKALTCTTSEDEMSRFTSPDEHCDAIKGNNNWIDSILNPLEIDPDDKIFKFNFDGSITIDSKCPSQLVDKAKNTIDYLNLSESIYLKEARSTILNYMLAIFSEDSKIIGEEAAFERLRDIYLSGDIIKFYSCKLEFFL